MSTNTTDAAFFPRLLGTRHGREVKVSAAFAACFDHSRVFQRCVIDLLSRLCGVRGTAAAQWSCETEVRQPKVGRIDLQLTGARGDGLEPVSFWIESKVEAPLTEEQLRRYRRIADGRFLVALTKHPPETGSRWLGKKGIFSLRWQDIHRELKSAKASGADGFLVHGFIEYLEALGMAHREDIDLDDLRRFDRLLTQIDSPKKSEMRLGNAFEVGAACLGVADDVLQAVLDAHGKRLAKWSRWGPSYLKWFENGDSHGHLLGFRFHDPGWKNWFGGAFHFPGGPHRDPVWFVNGHVRGRSVARDHALSRLVSPSGAIDAQKLAERFGKTLKPLKVL